MIPSVFCVQIQKMISQSQLEWPKVSNTANKSNPQCTFHHSRTPMAFAKQLITSALVWITETLTNRVLGIHKSSRNIYEKGCNNFTGKSTASSPKGDCPNGLPHWEEYNKFLLSPPYESQPKMHLCSAGMKSNSTHAMCVPVSKLTHWPRKGVVAKDFGSTCIESQINWCIKPM